MSHAAPSAAGRTVTGFADVEEDQSDAVVWPMGLRPQGTHVMPGRIEDDSRAAGANDIQAGAWRPSAVRDGLVIGGQQDFPGGVTARLVIAALGR
jgi:putative intracellular protease/amidase